MSNTQRQRPGQLEEKLTLRRTAKTPDGGGGFERHKEVIATVRGRVRPMFGNERLNNERVENQAGYVVTIRNRPDIDEAVSIHWHQANRLLNITFVRRSNARNLYLELETNMGRPV